MSETYDVSLETSAPPAPTPAPVLESAPDPEQEQEQEGSETVARRATLQSFSVNIKPNELSEDENYLRGLLANKARLLLQAFSEMTKEDPESEYQLTVKRL